MSTTYKYLLHTIDLQNENPWENKGIYMLYSDLVFGFLRVCLYFAFVGIMVRIHTFPLFAIRPIYMSLRFVLRQLLTNRLIYNYFCRTFKKCFNDEEAKSEEEEEEVVASGGGGEENPESLIKSPQVS